MSENRNTSEHSEFQETVSFNMILVDVPMPTDSLCTNIEISVFQSPNQISDTEIPNETIQNTEDSSEGSLQDILILDSILEENHDVVEPILDNEADQMFENLQFPAMLESVSPIDKDAIIKSHATTIINLLLKNKRLESEKQGLHDRLKTCICEQSSPLPHNSGSNVSTEEPNVPPSPLFDGLDTSKQ